MTISGLPPFGSMMIWGLLATIAMTTILQGAQGMGLSRLSLPFLAGTFFTGNRRWAVIVGFYFLRDRRLVVRLPLFSALRQPRALHLLARRCDGAPARALP